MVHKVGFVLGLNPHGEHVQTKSTLNYIQGEGSFVVFIVHEMFVW